MAFTNRLSIRLIGATLGLLLLTWVLLVVDRLQVEQEALALQLDREGQAIANAVASAAVTHMPAAEDCRPFIERLVAVNAEVALVRLVDERSRPLIEVRPGGREAESTEDTTHYEAPVFHDGQRLGVAHVFMSQLRSRRELASRLRDYMSMNLSAFALVAVVLALLIRQFVGLPLEQLASQADALGRGDLNMPVELDSGTELGDLARRLDEMRRHLKTNQRVLTATNTKLNDALTSLDKALDEAHAASRSKDDFLATMSHEIRTPMNGVLGMAEVLRGMELDEEQRGVVDTIYHSAESLLAIINDVLDFSKIEAGRLEMEALAFDLRGAFEEVLELLAVQAQGKPVELLLRYPADVPRLLVGDAVRLRQVVTNLVGNGIKFTSEGHVMVDVTCEAPDLDRATLLVRVEDTGIGISTDKLESIFDRFTQADSSTTRNYGGTGLGLAITRRLIEMMGGEIGVDSVYGQGSTFWFRLSMPLAGQPAPAVAPAPLRGLRALVVDDHPLTREVLAAQLTELGLTAHAVASAPEALQTLQLTTKPDSRLFDVLLIDDDMPDYSGSDLARELAAEDRFGELMILLLYQRGQEEISRRLPLDGSVPKPARLQDLSRALQEALSRRGAARESATAPPETQELFAREKPAPEAGPLSGRVLLVEDNKVNQKVALSMLRKLGLEVEVANNGQEGVSRSMEGSYHVILMDCQMPVMDGFEATREIRHWEHLGTRRTPIIAMTANAMEGDRERCLEAGMDDYIPKPVKRATLEETLTRWLRLSQATPDDASADGISAIFEAVDSQIEELTGPLLDEVTTVDLEIDPELDHLVAADPSALGAEGAVDTRPETSRFRREEFERGLAKLREEEAAARAANPDATERTQNPQQDATE